MANVPYGSIDIIYWCCAGVMSFCLTVQHGRAGVRADIGDNSPKKVLRALPVTIDNSEKNCLSYDNA